MGPVICEGGLAHCATMLRTRSRLKLQPDLPGMHCRNLRIPQAPPCIPAHTSYPQAAALSPSAQLHNRPSCSKP